MVDLGFLLIAFFVMTTEMAKPYVVDLNMPKEDNDTPAPPLKKSNALTLLISNHTMFYYSGDWQEAKASNQVLPASFNVQNGIGSVIRERQRWLDKALLTAEGGDGLVFLIKPGPGANYQQIIDALDEMQINGVKRYMIVKPSQEEFALLSKNH